MDYLEQRDEIIRLRRQATRLIELLKISVGMSIKTIKDDKEQIDVLVKLRQYIERFELLGEVNTNVIMTLEGGPSIEDDI